MSKRITKLRVLIRDNFTCQYCQVKADSYEDRMKMTVDHVIPKSRGGTNHELNLVAACQDCNRKKGSVIYPHANRKMNAGIREYVKKLEAKVFDFQKDRIK